LSHCPASETGATISMNVLPDAPQDEILRRILLIKPGSPFSKCPSSA
jgi:hypothetical protein